MKVPISRDVEINTEVQVGIEDITAALCEALGEVQDHPRPFAVHQFLAGVYGCLSALTEDHIALLKPETAELVATRLGEQAARFRAAATNGARSS